MSKVHVQEETLGELFHRLVDDGRAYALAEVDVLKTVARTKIAGMKIAAILFVIAVLLVIGAVVTLLVGFALGLVPFVGPVAAGAIVALGAIVVAGVLAWIGARSLGDQK